MQSYSTPQAPAQVFNFTKNKPGKFGIPSLSFAELEIETLNAPKMNFQANSRVKLLGILVNLM